MSTQNLNYIFNITGKASTVLNNIDNGLKSVQASGREGSAKLPQIKQALEQCGMAAKGANVSFEEANAAIQVLDKASKKGGRAFIDKVIVKIC